MKHTLTSVLVLLTGLSGSASAQCRDYADGFALEQNGFQNVQAAVVFDDGGGPALYVTGYQAHARGSRYGLWRWDDAATTWVAIGPTLPWTVWSLAVFDDGTGPALYLGGNTSANGGAVRRWNGSAFVTLGATGPNHEVKSLCVHDSGSGPALYAAGRFTSVDGLPASRVARWDGNAWSAVGLGVNGLVNDLASFGAGAQARLVACGEFTQTGATPASHVAQWNGTTWSALGTGLTGGEVWANDLHVANLGTGSLLYVGGQFNSAGGSPASNVARWTGSAWFGMPGTVTGQVYAIGDWNDGSGPGVAVAGPDSIGALVTSSLARWSGTAWSALGSGIAGGAAHTRVEQFAKSPFGGAERLWIFGGLTTAGGKPSVGAAVWGVPCAAPTVVTPPVDVVADAPAAIDLSIAAVGTLPIAYQWRRDGVALTDVLNVVDGATTASLRLWRWSLDDAGQYDCVVTNVHGSVASAAATVTVPMWTPNGQPAPVAARVLRNAALPDASTIGDAFVPVPTSDGAIHMTTTAGSGANPSPEALCQWNAGAFAPLLRTGDPAPGFPPGSVYGRYDDHPLQSFSPDGIGRTVAVAHVEGPGVTNANDEGVFRVDGAATHLIAREGDVAPGLTPTAVFFDFPGECAVALPDGRVVLDAVWKDGALAGDAIWSWTSGGGLVLLVKSGDPVPGSATTFKSLACEGLIGPNGGFVFEGEYGPSYDSGCFEVAGGVVTRILGAGDQAPGFPPGTILARAFATHANSSGDVIVTGYVWDGVYTRSGLYRWDGTTLTTIGVYDQVVAGTGANDRLDGFRALGFNDLGHVLFSAVLQGSCSACPTQALYLWKEPTLNLVTTNAVEVPNGSSDGELWLFDMGALDESDRVVFQARHAPSGGGVYAWSLGAPVFPVVAPGQQVLRQSGSYATILGSAISGRRAKPETDGPSSCLDRAGEIVLRVVTSDPSASGVYALSWSDLETLYLVCPVVVASPEPDWILPGATATFTVLATGAGPLAYRWTKDGTDLFDGGGVAGADTAQLTLSSATAADDGVYAARVTNGCGTVTSDGARLEVLAALPFCAGDNAGTLCPCAPSAVADAVGCLNSLGVGGRLRASGDASLSADTFALAGDQMPNSSALYFQGTARAGGGNGTRFGDGLRCASGAVVRLGTKANAGGASGYPAPGDASVSVRGQVAAPGMRTYQVWYRNAANFCTGFTFNLTNGIVVTWTP